MTAKYISRPFGQKSIFDRRRPDKTQTAIAYDILSEGEIEGLDNDLASVFINDVPIVDAVAVEITKSRVISLDTTASSTSVTDSVFGTIRNLSSNNKTGLALGDRTIAIEKAGKKGTGIANATADSYTVTTSSSFFTADLVNSLKGTGLTGFIRVAGAGKDGSDLVTTANFVSATEIRTNNVIATTVSNANIFIDLITKISSISSNTATLATAPAVSLTATTAIISGAAVSSETINKLFNFENLDFAFTTGAKVQNPLLIENQGTSATVATPNIELEQNDLRSNVGTSGNLSSSSYNNELDEPSQAAGTAADTVLTAAAVDVSNPSEIDEIHLTFNFPACHALKSSSGAKGPSFVELQIFFEYSTDGGSSYVSELAFGPSNSDIQNRTGGHSNRNVNFTKKGNSSSGTNSGYIKPSEAQYNAFVEEFVIKTQQFQPYDDWRIRVRRINDLNYKDGSFQHTNPCILQAVESIVTDKLTYPYTSYAGIGFNAKDFDGQIPERSYTLKGLRVQVPTNYRTRDETGGAAAYTRNVTSGATESSYQNWDGNFRGDIETFNAAHVNHTKVYTDNPVWIFYDIITNERYGMGQFIDKSQIDKYQLFRLAKFCDEEVDDGEGGTEPRFTCNVFLGKATEATNVLKQFASVFRGMVLWIDGELTAISDQEKEPVYLFNKSNIKDGLFAYEGTGERTRANQIKVMWNDPDDNFVQTIEYVEDYQNIAETGKIIRKDLLAFGTTSRGQAHRLGKWKLLSEKYEKETVSFVTGLNGAGLRPGDIIAVQDADRDRISFSGRISNTGTKSTTVIPLDRTIALPSYSSDYPPQLLLIYPSGGAYLNQETATISSTVFNRGDLITSVTSSTAAANLKDDSNNSVNVHWSENVRVEKQTVSTSAGSVSSLTVNSAFSAVPNSEVIYALQLFNSDGTEKTGSAKEYKVVSVKEKENFEHEIVASAFYYNKFAEVERGYKLDERERDTRPTSEDVIPAPKNIVVNVSPKISENAADGTNSGITQGNQVSITWDYPVNADGSKYGFTSGFEIEHDFEGKMQTVRVGNIDQSITFFPVIPGDYIIKIRTVSTIGTLSTFTIREATIQDAEFASPTATRVELIPKGGQLDTTLSLSSDTISIANSTYEFTNPNQVTFQNTSTNTSTYQQSFDGMGASAEAFLLFDADASATGDRLKAIQVHTDSTNVNPSVSYVKEVGASNDGLSSASGTVTVERFSNQIDGSSTAFTSDYSAGDLIKIENGSSTTQTINGAVSSSTSITLSGTNSSIEVGQTVTGSGISETIFVTAISGTSLTVSSKQTISDGVTLTFTPRNDYRRIRFIESNTLMFTEEIFQRPYSGASIKKQSFKPDFVNDAILLQITTDGSTNYSIASKFVVETGQTIKIVQLFKLNDSTFGTTTAGTFADPTNGVESGWSTTQPALSSDGDEVYMVQRTFTSDGKSPQTSTWSSPVVVAKRTDGAAGSAGLRQVQGYLYYEKTTNTGVAPSTPGSTTYTFSTGDIDGGSGATEVLALADTSATDKWTNSPRTQDVGSTSSFWTVRYSGGESSAGSSTCTVSYSTIVAQTAFTGVVTFSGGTTFQEDGSNIFDITSIDGGNIQTGTIVALGTVRTGTIRSNDHSGTGDGSGFSSDGTQINLSDGSISSQKFRVASNGDAVFAGELSAASGTFGGALSGGTISIGSSNNIFKADSNGIYLGNATFSSAPFRVTPAGALTADSATLTNATVSGTVTASAINLDTATITGTLDADKLQIDDVTIDTDGSGNLIIKSAGVSATQLGTRAAGSFKAFTTGPITIGNPSSSSDQEGAAPFIEVISFGTDGSNSSLSIAAQYTNQGSFSAGEAGVYSVQYSGVLIDSTQDFAGDDAVELLLQVFNNRTSNTDESKQYTITAKRALGFSVATTFTATQADETYQIRVFAKDRNGLTDNAVIDSNFLQVMRITKGN